MATKRLLIFNPETEFALASGSVCYTPPRSVVEFRAKNALVPLIYARRGDAVLVRDEIDLAGVASDIQILTPRSKTDWSQFTAEPWGWNPEIRHYLMRNCPGLQGIPDAETIETFRQLAHRRIASKFLLNLKDMLPPEIVIPKEHDNIEGVMNCLSELNDAFLKAPWSSSGRGVIRTSLLRHDQIESWVRGIIRSQRSVIVEKAYDKNLDFATEWIINNGEARFLGLSVFETSIRGKYHGNMEGSQKELLSRIRRNAPRFEDHILAAQREALNKIIAPHYRGHLGIDMMALASGEIHPCVEINLRRTMGSILLEAKTAEAHDRADGREDP